MKSLMKKLVILCNLDSLMYLRHKILMAPLPDLSTFPEVNLYELPLSEFKRLFAEVKSNESEQGGQKNPSNPTVGLPIGKKIAYFTSEIALSGLIFSGGLGKLAADIARAAADVGLEMTIVSLLYKKWRKQEIIDGRYEEEVFEPDYKGIIEPILDKEGKQLKIRLNIGNQEINVKLWKIEVMGESGKISVILLDSPEITQYLYPEDQWLRFQQDLLLGIGGCEALKAMGLIPEIIHMNEAATSFAIAYARTLFPEAISIFTTHTPEKAALREYPEKWWEYTHLPDDLRPLFIREGRLSLIHGGMGLADLIFAVSREHGETTKQMFPEYTDKITYVTNGSHAYWRAEELKGVRNKEELRQIKQQILKLNLLDFVEGLTGIRLLENRAIVLFTRRVVPYKRLWMVINNEELVEKMLKDREEGGMGMVLVVAGYPYDTYGVEMINKVIEFQKRYPGRIVFVPGYDLDLKVNRILLAGADMILHIPELMREASGTSFQMAAWNGTVAGCSRTAAPLEQIEEFDPHTGRGNGFFMKKDDHQGLMEMLRRMSDLYYTDLESWKIVSWNAFQSAQKSMSAQRMIGEYIKIYSAIWRYKNGILRIDNMVPKAGEVILARVGDKVVVSIDVEINP